MFVITTTTNRAVCIQLYTVYVAHKADCAQVCNCGQIVRMMYAIHVRGNKLIVASDRTMIVVLSRALMLVYAILMYLIKEIKTDK